MSENQPLTFKQNHRQWADVLPAALILVAIAAAYGNSLWGPFIFDDEPAIVHNPTIRELQPVWKSLCPPADGCTVRGRPVLNFSLAVNYALHGLNVGGYHVVNLAIHMAAALALFGIVRRTAVVFPGSAQVPAGRAKAESDSRGRASGPNVPRRPKSGRNRRAHTALANHDHDHEYMVPDMVPGMVPDAGLHGHSAFITCVALTVALLWAVHPLQTESVTYIAQRAESLMGLFFLLTLYCFIRGAQSGKATSWHAASVLACLLGMATKEVVLSAPLLVLLYDRAFLAGSFREAWLRRRGYYLALAATWLVLAGLVANTGLLARSYAGRLPSSQWFTWREYLATQPGVIVHYLRLAFWPSQLCLDYNWPAARTAAAVLPPAIVVIAQLALTAWTVIKRPAWGFLAPGSSSSLRPRRAFCPSRAPRPSSTACTCRWRRLLAALWPAQCLAGQWLAHRGMIAPRTLLAGGGCLAICAAVALGALTFQRNARYRSEESIWRDTLAKSPGSYRAHANLGAALARHGRLDEAADELKKALEIMPDFEIVRDELGVVAEGQCKLGEVLAEHGEPAEALDHYEKALDNKPDLADAHFGMGNALIALGRSGEAIRHYEKAVAIKPDEIAALNNLAWLRATHPDPKLRDGEKAVAAAQRAVNYSPDDPNLLGTLAAALAEAGRFREAARTASKAADIALRAGNRSLAESIQVKLRLYETGKPFREPGSL